MNRSVRADEYDVKALADYTPSGTAARASAEASMARQAKSACSAASKPANAERFQAVVVLQAPPEGALDGSRTRSSSPAASSHVGSTVQAVGLDRSRGRRTLTGGAAPLRPLRASHRHPRTSSFRARRSAACAARALARRLSRASIHSLNPTDANRRQPALVLQAADLRLDGSASSIEVAPTNASSRAGLTGTGRSAGCLKALADCLTLSL